MVEIYAYLVAEPIAKRRDEWVQDLCRHLIDMEQKFSGFSVEALKDDPAFTTVILNATQIAMRNHQREKIEALRNAVLNAALGKVPDETERALMLTFVDRLTTSHLAMLAVMRNPEKHPGLKDARSRFGRGTLNVILGQKGFNKSPLA